TRTKYNTNGVLSNRIRRDDSERLVGDVPARVWVRGFAAALLVVVVASCRTSTPRDAMPAAGPAPLPPEVLAAESALRDLRGDDAERVLLESGGVDVAAPERSFLLLDLWMARAAIERARRAVRDLSPGPVADLLRAHVEPDPEERIRVARRQL